MVMIARGFNVEGAAGCGAVGQEGAILTSVGLEARWWDYKE